MKNNKIVSGIKAAGVVTTAVFTMASCGNKHLSESQTKIVEHKTDSALAVHPEYRMASGLLAIGESKNKGYHDANRNLVKMYTREYIKNNIQDPMLRRYMLNYLEQGLTNPSIICDEIEADSINSVVETSDLNMRCMRRDYRWFYDLMLYLSDKYTDKQLLNSQFFKVVDDPEFKTKFEYFASKIDFVNSSVEFAVERKKIIREQTWNKYAQEVQKKR